MDSARIPVRNGEVHGRRGSAANVKRESSGDDSSRAEETLGDRAAAPVREFLEGGGGGG
jgi:hypothetical protein